MHSQYWYGWTITVVLRPLTFPHVFMLISTNLIQIGIHNTKISNLDYLADIARYEIQQSSKSIAFSVIDSIMMICHHYLKLKGNKVYPYHCCVLRKPKSMCALRAYAQFMLIDFGFTRTINILSEIKLQSWCSWLCVPLAWFDFTVHRMLGLLHRTQPCEN